MIPARKKHLTALSEVLPLSRMAGMLCAGLVLFFALSLSTPGTAQAACASPTGVAGQMQYDSTDGVVKYCDNTNWVEFPSLPGGGGTVAPSSGLVGHWALDETSGTTIADSAGSNTGTWNGSASVNSVAGQVGTALQFDGSNDYIDITNEANFDFETNDPFTIAAWIYRSSGTNEDDIVAKFDSSYQGYALWLPGSGAECPSGGSNCIYVSIIDPGWGALQAVTNNSIISNGSWHHVAMTYDGSETVAGTKIYVDGTSVSLNTISNNLSSAGSVLNNQNIQIGWDWVSPGCCEFGGNIDDVRIYGRALSASEISDLYNATGSGCSSPTGVPGMMIYDSTANVPVYCNGSSWVEAGPNPGAGGAGCSSPSGAAGTMIYDSTNNVMTYCDGANWISIGK